MANKEQNTQPSTMPISVHQTYLNFLTSVLHFLQKPEASEDQHGQDLAEVERYAVSLKNELPAPHTKRGQTISPTIDEVVKLCREYYPSEGDSPELAAAIEKLTTTVAEEFGVSA